MPSAARSAGSAGRAGRRSGPPSTHIAHIDEPLDHASVEAKGEAGLVLGADLAGQRNDLAAGMLLHGDRANGPGLRSVRRRLVAARRRPRRARRAMTRSRHLDIGFSFRWDDRPRVPADAPARFATHRRLEMHCISAIYIYALMSARGNSHGISQTVKMPQAPRPGAAGRGRRSSTPPSACSWNAASVRSAWTSWPRPPAWPGGRSTISSPARRKSSERCCSGCQVSLSAPFRPASRPKAMSSMCFA